MVNKIFVTYLQHRVRGEGGKLNGTAMFSSCLLYLHSQYWPSPPLFYLCKVCTYVQSSKLIIHTTHWALIHKQNNHTHAHTHTHTHTLGETIVPGLDQDVGSGLWGERTGTADDIMRSVGNANQGGYPSRHGINVKPRKGIS